MMGGLRRGKMQEAELDGNKVRTKCEEQRGGDGSVKNISGRSRRGDGGGLT